MSKIIIFTDGACSKNPGPGGWAAILNHEEDYTVLSGHEVETTNNRMELLAVIEGIKEAKRLKYTNITINSDSAYVVNAIKKQWLISWKMNNWRTKSGDEVKNSDLWKELDKLLTVLRKQQIKFTINKVPGHSGNTFNEIADYHAKQEVEYAKKLI